MLLYIKQLIQKLAMDWTVWGLNPGGGEIFRTCPDRPWGPSSLLYNGYRVFTGVKQSGHVDHLPPSSAEVEGRVKLYICSPPGPSWPVLGWTLPFYLYLYCIFKMLLQGLYDKCGQSFSFFISLIVIYCMWVLFLHILLSVPYEGQ
jgi:hypothetical protein